MIQTQMVRQLKNSSIPKLFDKYLKEKNYLNVEYLNLQLMKSRYTNVSIISKLQNIDTCLMYRYIYRRV